MLNPRFDLRRHSPTGFGWGYCGSGPAQLALALLAAELGDDESAQEHYQEYKREVLAVLPQSADHQLSGESIRRWMLSHNYPWCERRR